VIDKVDLDQVVAWKNGYFSFFKADLQTVMRQIARWYDVEISYEGKISERQFGGKIDRNSNVQEVLKILEESKVHFKMEEKKIIVLQ
jgi:transmembrane sensor